jgi:uncharacterized protein
MICDIHVHAIELKSPAGRERAARFRRTLPGRLIFKESDIDSYDGRYMAKALEESRMVDGAVFLAMDGAVTKNEVVTNRDVFKVSNEYVAELAASHSKACFGASINPYRKDALAELEKAIKAGACLVKWIPATQNIDPADSRCLPFYEMLAHYHLPLLCHTGNEHFMPHGDNHLNDPRKLIPALKKGVTVIGAHCGARMFLHEKCYFKHWKKMALEHENFYGDTGAFILPTRIKYLKLLLADSRLLDKALYASDLPMKPWLWSCLFRLGKRNIKDIAAEHNPFDRHYLVFQKMGFPSSFFSRGATLLRLPKEKVIEGGR